MPYVQNVTDIDDPLLERAARDQDDWVVLGLRETALFREDMAALRVIPPRYYVGAVEAMGEIAELVGKLLAEGAAYRVDDPQYPRRLLRQRRHRPLRLREHLRRGDDGPALPASAAATRTGPASATRWTRCCGAWPAPGEPSWESELGPGRPGWHVECAAIALNRLGPQIDLNGGGSDLIFPHHECGAAHAEAHTGVHPFAKAYVHAGMIGLDGEKMSKSRGNLVFVSKLRSQGVDPNAIRLALFAGHYRSDRAWTAELLTAAQERLAGGARPSRATPGPDATDLVARLREHLADDLDTPGALAAVDAWAAQARAGGGDDATAPRLVRDAVDALLGVAL